MPIKTVINKGTKFPIKIWLDANQLEELAVSQLINTANLPFIYKHVAVMPDVHAGRGSTIGTVIATKGAVIPACVGVDIGCGMMATQTNINADQILDKAAEIRSSIERRIPVGFNSNRNTNGVDNWAEFANMVFKMHFQDIGTFKKAATQLGTLGGGNHFIEICRDQENKVWIMLHSGSRNLGKTVADFYIDKAKRSMESFFIQLADSDLSYLPEGTDDFTNYINDVSLCQSFALQNRVEMMNRCLQEFAYRFNNGDPIETKITVNCHHNYIEREHHFGENVLVTRKGAVRARKGDMGIIPGSMGVRSFIVRGLGNEESFHSCSHGAGRTMSRTKARKTFTLEDFKKQTEGVECRKDNDVIDEIPGAYKDIDMVINSQTDLVEVVAELKQMICIKG